MSRSVCAYRKISKTLLSAKKKNVEHFWYMSMTERIFLKTK